MAGNRTFHKRFYKPKSLLKSDKKNDSTTAPLELRQGCRRSLALFIGEFERTRSFCRQAVWDILLEAFEASTFGRSCTDAGTRANHSPTRRMAQVPRTPQSHPPSKAHEHTFGRPKQQTVQSRCSMFSLGSAASKAFQLVLFVFIAFN